LFWRFRPPVSYPVARLVRFQPGALSVFRSTTSTLPRRSPILALSFSFALLAVAVRLGAFTWLDQFAVDHLMPGLDPAGSATIADALLPFDELDSPWEIAADIVLYPASFPISGLILVGCAVAFCRRGRAREGALWVGAWLVGTAVEAVVKHVLERPALYADGRDVTGFDHALPSGHSLRSLLVAAALTSLARRGRWAWAWVAGVWVLLVVAGWHTPTDVVAGVLLGSVFALAVRAARVETATAG
jgi:membrane-associated phospholipid phosphatase